VASSSDARGMTVLVTDGEERASLAITRSLGRKGVHVHVAGTRLPNLAAVSRYCARRATYPSPWDRPASFEHALESYLDRERIDVLLPVTDLTTRQVVSQQARLKARTAFAVPPPEAFDLASDKARIVERAQRSGIPVPRTILVDGLDAFEAAVSHVSYPAVVKPARSRMLTDEGWIGTTVQYASSEQALRQIYRDTPYLHESSSLIQERVVGPGVGLFALFDRGALVTAFAHRRLREKPPSGGVSVLRESIPLDRRLVRDAVTLLGPLGWHGVAMLEYKHERASGQHVLMEVNGRFWGSLQLAIDAGVDFPALMCELAQGERPAVPDRYRIGVKSRWLLGDLDHLLLRVMRSRGALSLPPDAPSVPRAIVEFLKFAGPGLRYEILRASDPAPFMYEARLYLAGLAGAARERVSRWSGASPRADRLPAAEHEVQG
jgi:predicted ATP-grasp superfamily ATP-dependent carboligase